MGVKLLHSLYPASRVLSYYQRGPDAFLFRSWVLSHGIAPPSLGYTDTALCILPFGSWVTWLWPGIAEAKLRCSSTRALEPEAGLGPTIHRVPLLPPHSLCHYCISPSWGHAMPSWWGPKDSRPWLRGRCAHAYPSGTGTSITAALGAPGQGTAPCAWCQNPGSTATECQCAKIWCQEGSFG